jgi:hypothetical protein
MPSANKILSDLRRSTLDLKTWMENNPQLDLLDQMLIQDNIQMLKITYAAWKSRNAGRTTGEQ